MVSALGFSVGGVSCGSSVAASGLNSWHFFWLAPITKIPNVGTAYKKKRIADVAVSQSPFKVVFKLCSDFTVSPQILHHNNFIARIENKIVSLHPTTTFTCTTIGTLVVGTTNTNDLVLGYMHTYTLGPRPKVYCANA